MKRTTVESFLGPPSSATTVRVYISPLSLSSRPVTVMRPWNTTHISKYLHPHKDSMQDRKCDIQGARTEVEKYRHITKINQKKIPISRLSKETNDFKANKLFDQLTVVQQQEC